VVNAQGLNASYKVFPNGSGYKAFIEIGSADEYRFTEVGILGERTPIEVTGVELSGNCSPCNFTWIDPTIIRFVKGNYTISYQNRILENHLQGIFDEPYNVTVEIPKGFDVRNPFIGMISQGGLINISENGLYVNFTRTRQFETRFYDSTRETILYLFGNFWLLFAAALLVPYAITWQRKKQ